MVDRITTGASGPQVTSTPKTVSVTTGQDGQQSTQTEVGSGSAQMDEQANPIEKPEDQTTNEGQGNPEGTTNTEEGQQTAEQTPQEGDNNKDAQPDSDGAATEGSQPTTFETVKADLADKIIAGGGTVSDADINAAAEQLKDSGLTAADIRMQVRGYQSVINDMQAVFGGKEGYAEFNEWASKEGNLQPEQIDAFNAHLSNADFDKALSLVKQFSVDFKAQGGGTPARDITQGAQPAPTTQQGPKGYESTAAMMRDINNPLYNSDPAFREQVMARIGATQN